MNNFKYGECNNCDKLLRRNSNYCVFCGDRIKFFIDDISRINLIFNIFKAILYFFGKKYIFCKKCFNFCYNSDTFCYICGNSLKKVKVVERNIKKENNL